jgi:hypothetical protein
MSIKSFKVQQFSDVNLSLLNSALREWTVQFKEIPFLQGRSFNVSITTSGLELVHNLGRQPNGWIILGKDANVDIWETGKSPTILSLDADGTTNFSIWVF